MATPVEALRLECGLLSFNTKKYRIAAKLAEKAMRLPPDHPRYIAYHSHVEKRLKKENWRDYTETLCDMSQIDRVPITNFTSLPWMEAKSL